MLVAYLIGIVLLVWILLFYNLPAFFWFLSSTVIVFISYYNYKFLDLSWVNLFWIALAYLIFCSILVVLSVKTIRRHLITRNILPKLKKQLPKISSTEEQAIEAGDVWWEGDIFSGNLDWSKYNDYKIQTLSDQEQDFLDTKVNRLCELLNDWAIMNKHKDLSSEAWQYIKENKFLAIHIPKAYGGLEFSAAAHSAIVTKVASKSITAAVTIMVPNALGPGELLMHYGNAEQKTYYLPRLANGDEIPCFALTSAHAGSDAGGMLDYGVICKQSYNNKEILGIKLNFSKRYITLAPVATVMGLAFKLYDPDQLYSKVTDLGVTLALIPTNTPGIEIGKRHLAMMVPFQNGPIRGTNVFIPIDYIIGGTDYIGKGWFMLMECLSGGRGISLPALSAATCQVSYLSSVIYSNLRVQFKTAIAKLEGIEEQLAKLAGYNFICNAVRTLTVSAIDHGLKPAVISAITKYHLTEFARKAINCAMDIHAGKGVMSGPKNYLTAPFIANPVAITVEGANILTRNLIIFGQGAFRAHPFVLEEILALKERNSSYALRRFDKVLFKHIKYTFSTLTRLKTYNLQRVFYKITRRNNWLKAYQKDLVRLSSALALATDMALLFIGGKLKTKERLSSRLGDVVSYIYMGICVIKYYQDLPNKKDYENITKWCLDYCLYKAQKSLIDYARNFPTRTIGVWLRVVMFPWGLSYKKPNDRQDADLNQVLNLSDPLVSLVYSGSKDNKDSNAKDGNSSPLDILVQTYKQKNEIHESLNLLYNFAAEKKILFSNDLSKMLTDAFEKNLLNEAEFKKIKDYADNLQEIINVDEFESL